MNKITEKNLAHPSDVGGSCPSPSYLYHHEGTEYCCCENGCCWNDCSHNSPPQTCLSGVPGAKWVYNSTTSRYRAFVPKGNICICLITVLYARVLEYLIMFYHNKKCPCLVMHDGVVKCGQNGWFSKITTPDLNARQICIDQGYTGRIDKYGRNNGQQCKTSNDGKNVQTFPGNKFTILRRDVSWKCETKEGKSYVLN